LVDKSLDWFRKVSSSNLSQRVIFFCLVHQAKPSMSYGLVPIMDPPHVVEEAFQSLFFEYPAPMGVNGNITKGWRMLPLQY
jgi:hypothetical protein